MHFKLALIFFMNEWLITKYLRTMDFFNNTPLKFNGNLPKSLNSLVGKEEKKNILTGY